MAKIDTRKAGQIITLLTCWVTAAWAGAVWPKPLNQSRSSTVLYINEEDFKLKATGCDSEILQHALRRYEDILFEVSDADRLPADHEAERPLDFITTLKVHVASNDQSLNLQTDEGYTLEISAPTSSLSANTVFGALHGLETFSQLLNRLEPDPDDWKSAGCDEDAAEREEESAFLEHWAESADQEIYTDGQQRQQFSRKLQISPPSMQETQAPLPANIPSDNHSTAAAVNQKDTGSMYEETLMTSVGLNQSSEDDKKHTKKKHKKKQHKKKKHRKHHHKGDASYAVNATSIWDVPRFKHRGLLIDTARHYLPVSVILDHLDAMAYSKMNVLHWHIVDDQSFPFVSNELPLLSEKGAFAPNLVYTPKDVREVVSCAKMRGIRVIPEFDTPGHTLAWGAGYPDLLVDCYDDKGKPLGRRGPLNPASNETFEFLWTLLKEVASVFPDSYVHLGGDEVPFDCWLNNPDVQDWMAQQDPAIKSMPELEEYFERRVLDLAAAAGRSYIVWQEILDNNVKVQGDTVVHVWKWWWPTNAPPPDTAETLQSKQSRPSNHWKQDGHAAQASEKVCEISKGCMPEEGWTSDVPGWVHEMERVTSQGYRTLLSSPWYLNLGGFASNDWAMYYSVEPLNFQAAPEQKSLVIGGEACVWGEYVDATNAIQRTWPRAAAVAERLWSDASIRSPDDALPRLVEHRCRLLARGIAAEPLGPGFCPGEELSLAVVDLGLTEHQAADRLLTACKEVGFFYVSNHGISQSLLDTAMQQSKAFFALPLEEKQKVSASGDILRGYTPLFEEVGNPEQQSKGDFKEIFYCGEDIHNSKSMLTQPNLWPSEELLPGFKEVWETYFSEVKALGLRILRLIAIAFGLRPDFFEPWFQGSASVARPLHYTADKSVPEEGLFSVGSHTDFGFLTVLLLDEVPGLQIYLDEKWVDVPCQPGTFVVNIADLLERISNGACKSTLHRVINTSGKDRYSIPLFLDPNPEVTIECLPPCCMDVPPKFPPINAGEYLANRYRGTHESFPETDHSILPAAIKV